MPPSRMSPMRSRGMQGYAGPKESHSHWGPNGPSIILQLLSSNTCGGQAGGFRLGEPDRERNGSVGLSYCDNRGAALRGKRQHRGVGGVRSSLCARSGCGVQHRGMHWDQLKRIQLQRDEAQLYRLRRAVFKAQLLVSPDTATCAMSMPGASPGRLATVAEAAMPAHPGRARGRAPWLGRPCPWRKWPPAPRRSRLPEKRTAEPY